MTKPCGHDKPDPNCPTCLLSSDPAFAGAWGIAPPKRSPRGLPCAYLGEVTDKRGCNCPGRWKRKCALHGEITIGDNCGTCGDYDPM